jgi:subtilisin family serine protease
VDLSERALKRRVKAGAGLSFKDLPVCPAYISEMEAELGVGCEQVSNWLNAASFTVEKSELELIADKGYVAEIRPVARAQKAGYFMEQENITWQGIEGYDERFSERGHEGAFYGVSYDQLDQIEVIEAHRRGLYGDGVIIGVIDGGFMLDHRALAHTEVIAEWDFINNDDFTGFDAEQDIRGQPVHGTGCMSTIAGYDPGNLIGAAPFASFVLAKSEDDRGETPIEEDNWVAAIEWVERMGADVVSSSLSYKDWYVLDDFDGITPYASRAATIAYELGVVVCTSAGNEGPEAMSLGTPADADGVLAIGAVDSTGELVGFSSRGPTADGRIKPNICALGRHTTAVSPYTYDKYGLWNGTSLSCPLAAGGLALVVQAHPDWPSYKIYEAAENTATHAVYPDNDWGYGILQVAKALDYPSISGYVRDEGGLPVPCAKIYYKHNKADTGGVIDCNQNGFYILVNVPEGRFNLQAKAVGFQDSSLREAMVPPDDVLDFTLKKIK